MHFDKGEVVAALYTANQGLETTTMRSHFVTELEGFYILRAKIFEKQGNLAKAVKEYNDCLELNPNCLRAAYARAACENKRGGYDKSIDYYTFALELEDKLAKDKLNSTGTIERSFRKESRTPGVSPGAANKLVSSTKHFTPSIGAKRDVHKSRSKSKKNPIFGQVLIDLIEKKNSTKDLIQKVQDEEEKKLDVSLENHSPMRFS